jgi:UDP-N-acetyl-D-mannosaminuronic acid dehydrogenase
MDVGIIGGGGHVGAAMALVLADADHDIVVVDKDEDVLDDLANGHLPYREAGGEALLDEALAANRLEFTTSFEPLADCDVVVVVVGTPIDEHHNPQIEPLLDIFDSLLEHLNTDQTVLLRSTVYPGTTDIVRDKLESAGYSVGEDVYLAFTPERIAQHKAIEEMVGLPQLIGAFDNASYDRARAFFETFLEADCLRLTPTEAELGKLFTNMWRYLTFAIANEFYLIADSIAGRSDVNIHRILEKTAHNYPRFDVPSPGPNVGGPCLTKDGWFLVDDVPYNELVSTAFQINEGMPAQVIQRMSDIAPDPGKITILGMTFKANSDDTRNSVAFKLKRQLRIRGLGEAVCIEPNCDGFNDWDDIEGSDWVILMTPHDEFVPLEDIRNRVDNPDCCYCDIWGHWQTSKYTSDNGYFFGREMSDATTEPPQPLGEQ